MTLVSFEPEDPDGPRIVEQSTSGDTELYWQVIRSAWIDWVLADPMTRGAYAPAFGVVGGEERGGSAPRLGSTFFLLNGWKFRPAEYSHNVTIYGNVVSVPAGARIWVPTLGAFSTGVQLESSNLVDKVVFNTGSGVTPTDKSEIIAGTKAAILSDGQAFPGAFIDAAVSSAGGGSGGLTPTQAAALSEVQARMAEVWGRLWLDPANPHSSSETEVVCGDITIKLFRSGDTVLAVRQ